MKNVFLSFYLNIVCDVGLNGTQSLGLAIHSFIFLQPFFYRGRVNWPSKKFWRFQNKKSYYRACHLIGSRIIESAAYCNQIMLVPLYLNSKGPSINDVRIFPNFFDPLPPPHLSHSVTHLTTPYKRTSIINLPLPLYFFQFALINQQKNLESWFFSWKTRI